MPAQGIFPRLLLSYLDRVFLLRYFSAVGMICILFSGCEAPSGARSLSEEGGDMPLFDSTMKIPEYHKKFWRGYQVFDSTQSRFKDAPDSDQKMLKDYPYWIDKGPWKGKTRVTIVTAKTVYATGEAIRIGHVVDEAGPDRALYIMGPKEVKEELISEQPIADDTSATAQTAGDYPWLPLVYSGKTLGSPGIDYNFQVTEYRFQKAGKYYVQWRPGRFRSNILVITVE